MRSPFARQLFRNHGYTAFASAVSCHFVEAHEAGERAGVDDRSGLALDHVTPDAVHVLAGGRIVASGGPELAHELEREGYDKYARAA